MIFHKKKTLENKLEYKICKLSAYHVQKFRDGMRINKFG
jgi:hypothetical protein